MYVDKTNKKEEVEKSLSSCRLSCRRVMAEQTKRHQYDGNSLVYTSLFLHASVSLCHSVFSKKESSYSWPTFQKTKKNALTLETAPSLHSRHARKLPQVVVWLEEGRWELNIKKRGRERGKCLTREIFPNTTAYFCLKDLLSSLTLTVMLL